MLLTLWVLLILLMLMLLPVVLMLRMLVVLLAFSILVLVLVLVLAMNRRGTYRYARWRLPLTGLCSIVEVKRSALTILHTFPLALRTNATRCNSIVRLNFYVGTLGLVLLELLCRWGTDREL